MAEHIETLKNKLLASLGVDDSNAIIHIHPTVVICDQTVLWGDVFLMDRTIELDKRWRLVFVSESIQLVMSHADNTLNVLQFKAENVSFDVAQESYTQIVSASLGYTCTTCICADYIEESLSLTNKCPSQWAA